VQQLCPLRLLLPQPSKLLLQAGWDSLTEGWAGVMCCEGSVVWNGFRYACDGSNAGRVTRLQLERRGRALKALVPLTALSWVSAGSANVHDPFVGRFLAGAWP